MGLTFREAGAGDLPALVAFVNAAYRGEPSRAGWTTEADVLDGQRTDEALLAEELATTGALLVVAQEAGELAGCFLLEPDPGGSADGYVGMLTVAPTAQGSGRGSTLLAEAIRRSAAAGQPGLLMWVLNTRVELIAYYGRRGFLPTGATAPFPYGDERFGMPKRPDLAFVVLRRPAA